MSKKKQLPTMSKKQSSIIASIMQERNSISVNEANLNKSKIGVIVLGKKLSKINHLIAHFKDHASPEFKQLSELLDITTRLENMREQHRSALIFARSEVSNYNMLFLEETRANKALRLQMNRLERFKKLESKTTSDIDLLNRFNDDLIGSQSDIIEQLIQDMLDLDNEIEIAKIKERLKLVRKEEQVAALKEKIFALNNSDLKMPFTQHEVDVMTTSKINLLEETTFNIEETKHEIKKLKTFINKIERA